MMDKETGRHRGFGFVNYERREDVDKVLQSGPHYMDGQMVCPPLRGSFRRGQAPDFLFPRCSSRSSERRPRASLAGPTTASTPTPAPPTRRHRLWAAEVWVWAWAWEWEEGEWVVSAQVRWAEEPRHRERPSIRPPCPSSSPRWVGYVSFLRRACFSAAAS